MEWIKFEVFDKNDELILTEIVQVRMTASGSVIALDGSVQWRFRHRWESSGLIPWGRKRTKWYANMNIEASEDNSPIRNWSDWRLPENGKYTMISRSLALNFMIGSRQFVAKNKMDVARESRRREGMRCDYARQARVALFDGLNRVHQMTENTPASSEDDFILLCKQVWSASETLRRLETEAERRWPEDLSQHCLGDMGDMGELMLGLEEELKDGQVCDEHRER